MKETVIVTGGAGFVGSNLIKELLAKGYRVACIDNFDDTYSRALKEDHLAPFLSHGDFVLHEADIVDADAINDIFDKEKPTYVVHLAAKADTRDAVDNPDIYVSVNIHGTVHILESARKVGVKNTVIVSSSSVYGNDTPAPCKEQAPADRAISPYGATKRTAEMFAYAYHHNFGMNITCLRYFNVYGENNRPGMVPYRWAEALLMGKEIELSGSGTRKRDYTYVGDTVRATILALEKPLGYEILNVGNSHPVSLNELLSVFEHVIGTKAVTRTRESHKASVEVTCADSTKIKQLLGWEPEVSLEDWLQNELEAIKL